VDQRSIVLYLARKELSVIAIHHDLVSTLGPEAVSYSSVTCYLREAIFVSSNSHANIPEAEFQFDDCDQAILLALVEQPFASIRELAQLIHQPRTTVHRRLAQSLGFRMRHLQWVPIFCHTLKNWIAFHFHNSFYLYRSDKNDDFCMIWRLSMSYDFTSV
jgi:hypothetical protein